MQQINSAQKLKRIAIIVFASLFINSCLDPIVSVIGDYQDLLVVDAYISNEYSDYEVALSRTLSNIDEVIVAVENAEVYVNDDLGRTFQFAEVYAGMYKSDKSKFQGEVGRKYELNIKTEDGNIYRSNACLLNAPTQIDSIYFKKDTYWSEYENVNLDGLGIFIDGKKTNDDNVYLRWSYEEDWKFAVPYQTKYIISTDNSLEDGYVGTKYCWKNEKSTSIILHSFNNQDENRVEGKNLYVIPTEIVDKVTIRYTTLIKQHSISKQEYEFWYNQKQTTEDIGDVFGKQPFTLLSNIVNVNDSIEPVLGYFQVSGVTSKRIYIKRSDVTNRKIPMFDINSLCYLDSVIVDGEIYLSVYDIYKSNVINNDFSMIEPIYADSTHMIGLWLTRKSCADCAVTGEIEPPYFWED